MIIYNFSIDTLLGNRWFLDLTAVNMLNKVFSSHFLNLHSHQLNSSPNFHLTSTQAFQLTDFFPTLILSNSPTHLLSCSLTYLLTYLPTFSTYTSSSLVLFVLYLFQKLCSIWTLISNRIKAVCFGVCFRKCKVVDLLFNSNYSIHEM